MKPTEPKDLRDLIDDIDQVLVGRRAELELIALALVAKVHIFFLSVTGTAKTKMVNETVRRLTGARSYACMLNAFADDSLFFGPPSLDGLMAGKRTRVADRYLPPAHLFIADEIWEASEPLLKALHLALNERRWDDDGEQKLMELWTMLSISNTVPRQEHGELRAIWDRVGFRRIMEPLSDPADLRRLFQMRPSSEPSPRPEFTLLWDAVVDAHQRAMAIEVDPDAHEAFIAILGKLPQVFVSDRRKVEVWQIARASAWMAGRKTATSADLWWLPDYLWDEESQVRAVRAAVFEVIAPLRSEIESLTGTVGDVRMEYEAAARLPSTDRHRSAATSRLYDKCSRAAVLAVDIESRATDADVDTVGRLLVSIDLLARDVLTDLGGTQPANVPSLAAAARDGKL